ncbi:hypothetical protein BASA62_008957 [Batrachochytrium salamandrivorans]|nr:hypothetical protein BASA62_008957 [Batrachochytrium salamandrivorans]
MQTQSAIPHLQVQPYRDHVNYGTLQSQSIYSIAKPSVNISVRPMAGLVRPLVLDTRTASNYSSGKTQANSALVLNNGSTSSISVDNQSNRTNYSNGHTKRHRSHVDADPVFTAALPKERHIAAASRAPAPVSGSLRAFQAGSGLLFGHGMAHARASTTADTTMSTTRSSFRPTPGHPSQDVHLQPRNPLSCPTARRTLVRKHAALLPDASASIKISNSVLRQTPLRHSHQQKVSPETPVILPQSQSTHRCKVRKGHSRTPLALTKRHISNSAVCNIVDPNTPKKASIESNFSIPVASLPDAVKNDHLSNLLKDRQRSIRGSTVTAHYSFNVQKEPKVPAENTRSQPSKKANISTKENRLEHHVQETTGAPKKEDLKRAAEVRTYIKAKRLKERQALETTLQKELERQEKIANELKRIDELRRKQREITLNRAARINRGHGQRLSSRGKIGAPTGTDSVSTDSSILSKVKPSHQPVLSLEGSHESGNYPLTSHTASSKIVDLNKTATESTHHPKPAIPLNDGVTSTSGILGKSRVTFTSMGLTNTQTLQHTPRRIEEVESTLVGTFSQKDATAIVSSRIADAPPQQLYPVTGLEIKSACQNSEKIPLITTNHVVSENLEKTDKDLHSTTTSFKSNNILSATTLPISSTPSQTLLMQSLMHSVETFNKRIQTYMKRSCPTDMYSSDSFSENVSLAETSSHNEPNLVVDITDTQNLTSTLTETSPLRNTGCTQGSDIGQPALDAFVGGDEVGVSSLAMYSRKNLERDRRDRAALTIQSFCRRYSGPRMKVSSIAASNPLSYIPVVDASVLLDTNVIIEKTHPSTTMATSWTSKLSEGSLVVVPVHNITNVHGAVVTPESMPMDLNKKHISSSTKQSNSDYDSCDDSFFSAKDIVSTPNPTTSVYKEQDEDAFGLGYCTTAEADPYSIVNIFARKIHDDLLNKSDVNRSLRLPSVMPDPLISAQVFDTCNEEAAVAAHVQNQDKICQLLENVKLQDRLGVPCTMDIDDRAAVDISAVVPIPEEIQISCISDSSIAISDVNKPSLLRADNVVCDGSISCYSDLFESENDSELIKDKSVACSPIVNPPLNPKSLVCEPEISATLPHKVPVHIPPCDFHNVTSQTTPPRVLNSISADPTHSYVDTKDTLMDQSKGWLSPNSLSRKLEADIQLYSAIHDAHIQYTELDKNYSIAQARLETVALGQALKDQRYRHQIDLERAREAKHAALNPRDLAPAFDATPSVADASKPYVPVVPTVSGVGVYDNDSFISCVDSGAPVVCQIESKNALSGVSVHILDGNDSISEIIDMIQSKASNSIQSTSAIDEVYDHPRRVGDFSLCATKDVDEMLLDTVDGKDVDVNTFLLNTPAPPCLKSADPKPSSSQSIDMAPLWKDALENTLRRQHEKDQAQFESIKKLILDTNKPHAPKKEKVDKYTDHSQAEQTVKSLKYQLKTDVLYPIKKTAQLHTSESIYDDTISMIDPLTIDDFPTIVDAYPKDPSIDISIYESVSEHIHDDISEDFESFHTDDNSGCSTPHSRIQQHVEAVSSLSSSGSVTPTIRGLALSASFEELQLKLEIARGAVDISHLREKEQKLSISNAVADELISKHKQCTAWAALLKVQQDGISKKLDDAFQDSTLFSSSSNNGKKISNTNTARTHPVASAPLLPPKPASILPSQQKSVNLDLRHVHDEPESDEMSEDIQEDQTDSIQEEFDMSEIHTKGSAHLSNSITTSNRNSPGRDRTYSVISISEKLGQMDDISSIASGIDDLVENIGMIDIISPKTSKGDDIGCILSKYEACLDAFSADNLSLFKPNEFMADNPALLTAESSECPRPTSRQTLVVQSDAVNYEQDEFDSISLISQIGSTREHNLPLAKKHMKLSVASETEAQVTAIERRVLDLREKVIRKKQEFQRILEKNEASRCQALLDEEKQLIIQLHDLDLLASAAECKTEQKESTSREITPVIHGPNTITTHIATPISLPTIPATLPIIATPALDSTILKLDRSSNPVAEIFPEKADIIKTPANLSVIEVPSLVLESLDILIDKPNTIAPSQHLLPKQIDTLGTNESLECSYNDDSFTDISSIPSPHGATLQIVNSKDKTIPGARIMTAAFPDQPSATPYESVQNLTKSDDNMSDICEDIHVEIEDIIKLPIHTTENSALVQNTVDLAVDSHFFSTDVVPTTAPLSSSVDTIRTYTDIVDNKVEKDSLNNGNSMTLNTPSNLEAAIMCVQLKTPILSSIPDLPNSVMSVSARDELYTKHAASLEELHTALNICVPATDHIKKSNEVNIQPNDDSHDSISENIDFEDNDSLSSSLDEHRIASSGVLKMNTSIDPIASSVSGVLPSPPTHVSDSSLSIVATIIEDMHTIPSTGENGSQDGLIPVTLKPEDCAPLNQVISTDSESFNKIIPQQNHDGVSSSIASASDCSQKENVHPATMKIDQIVDVHSKIDPEIIEMADQHDSPTPVPTVSLGPPSPSIDTVILDRKCTSEDLDNITGFIFSELLEDALNCLDSQTVKPMINSNKNLLSHPAVSDASPTMGTATITVAASIKTIPAPTSLAGVMSLLDDILKHLRDPALSDGHTGYMSAPVLPESVLDLLPNTTDTTLHSMRKLILAAANEAIYDQFGAHRKYAHPLRDLIKKRPLKPHAISHSTLTAKVVKTVKEWAGYADKYDENLDVFLIDEVKQNERSWLSSDICEAEIRKQLEDEIWDDLLADTVMAVNTLYSTTRSGL